MKTPGGNGEASPEAYILLGMRRACAIIGIVALLFFPTQASAYAMLAHEAIIDVAWKSNPNAPNHSKKDAREWSQITQELSELKTAPAAQSLVK